LRRFTFTTLVESDQALPACGASLSQPSVLSVLSALLALFRCAYVSSFSILVQFFSAECDFSTHDVHQKADCSLLQKGVKRTRKPVTLKTKILFIRKMDDGEKRANICSSLGLAQATVPTIIANAEKN